MAITCMSVSGIRHLLIKDTLWKPIAITRMSISKESKRVNFTYMRVVGASGSPSRNRIALGEIQAPLWWPDSWVILQMVRGASGASEWVLFIIGVVGVVDT